MEVEKLTTNCKGDHERSDVNQKYGTLFNGFLSILITLNNHATLTEKQESINISRKRSPESGDIIGVTGIGRPHASMAGSQILVEVIKWIFRKEYHALISTVEVGAESFALKSFRSIFPEGDLGIAWMKYTLCSFL